MQLGFVIDHSRCIGCHACTVACKSENEVPLGSFRTWVKYTERGEFPQVKRSFAVLRCNQCTAAPCVTICPTSALEKRPDGIVDVNPDHCIGCKSCMQGCPYDALYIGMNGTAEKCHFCAHRTERGLAPACAVVCPTEAIIPGDFDDPQSVVARMKRDLGLEARKTEAATGPNVWYRDAEPAGLQPLTTNGSTGYIWSNRRDGVELDAEVFRAEHEAAQARTTYDVEHNQWWGWRVSAYLVTKAISAGVVLASVPTLLRPGIGDDGGAWVAALGIVFLLATTVLLVADLKRPERFLLILKRPNWNSWLVRGTVFLMGYGGLLTLWLALALTHTTPTGPLRFLAVAAMAVLGAGAAGYTGALFGQCRGRVLWMQRGLWLALIVRAAMVGGGLLLLLAPAVPLFGEFDGLRWITAAAVLGHFAFGVFAGRLAPRKREAEHHAAHQLLASGPFRGRHHLGLGLACLALLLLVLPVGGPWLPALGGLAAVVSLWSYEDGFVKAGQALPIS